MSTSSGQKPFMSTDEAFENLIERVAETSPSLRASTRIRPGVRLSNRFLVERKLGTGGMGHVFAALDESRQARVALKVLGKLTPRSLSLLKREFRAASELVHPNLVRLHELFLENGNWFFTMDLIEGTTLPELLRAPLERDPAWLRSVFRQLALALDALHKAGTLHRDLKPSNFLITPDFRVVLLDFGLAQPIGRLTGWESAGTPAYMAPEQCLGESLSEATDWYAFGVVLYEALTGKLPNRMPLPSLLSAAPRDLSELCQALLQLSPTDRPDAQQVLACIGASPDHRPSSLPPPPRPHLIGRARELGELEAALRETGAGVPAMVVLEGPSGIGKSALVEHFRHAAETSGAIVLRSRCRERESMSYKAIDGLIDELVTLLDSLPLESATQLLPSNIGELQVLFPAMSAASAVARLPTRNFTGADQALVRLRAIEAFGDLLSRLRQRGPLVLWIDDLHWSDAESALLLGPVLGGPHAVPLLFIGSTRSSLSGNGPLLDALERGFPLPEPRRLLIGPLVAEEAEQLAWDILRAHGHGDRSVARAIALEAGGHPLFVAELAHTPSPESAPARDSESSLFRLITDRVDHLSGSARWLLQISAIAGTPLQRTLLRRTRGLSPAEAEAALDALKAARLVQSEGLRDHDLVDVHHDRIREIVLQGLDDGNRRRLHLTLAQALTGAQGTPPELLATHYEAAGDIVVASRFWIRAADRAAQSLAFLHAAALYDRGLRQISGDPALKRDVQIRRAEVLARAGKGPDAADIYLEIASSSPPDDRIELQRRAAEQLLLAGHLTRGLELIARVLDAIDMPKPVGGRRALLAIAVGRLLVRLRGLRHRRRSEEALSREQRSRLDASWTIAMSLSLLDPVSGANFQNKHILLAVSAGEPRRLLRALTLEVSYAATPGIGSERRTQELLALADELVHATEDYSAVGMLHLARGIAAYLQSRVDAARGHCEDALAYFTTHCAGAVWETMSAQRFLIASLFFLGRLGRLSEMVPPVLAQAEGTGNHYVTTCFCSGYSTFAWLVRDDVAEAHRQLERARAHCRSDQFHLSHYNHLVGLTYADFYAGSPRQPLERLRELWPEIERSQLLRIGILRVQLSSLRAMAALSAAESSADPLEAKSLRDEARRMARTLRKQSVRCASPLGAVIDAAVLLAEGQRAAAVASLEVAEAEFERLGMVLFSAAVRVHRGDALRDETGQHLVDSGLHAIAAEGVAQPRRLVRALIAGFPNA